MRIRGGATISAMAIAGLAIGFITVCSGAKARKAENSARGEPAWHDCQKAAADAIPAIDAARQLLSQTWLANRNNFFAAYTMPGEKRSPFDLSPREPNSGPVGGTVEARAPHCIYRMPDASDGPHEVRFISPFYRFYESEHGWSPPLRNGLMLDAIVTKAGNEWKTAVPPSETTILLPEQNPRRPEEAQIPADAPWSEPIPGCSRRQKWDGNDCIPRRQR